MSQSSERPLYVTLLWDLGALVLAAVVFLFIMGAVAWLVMRIPGTASREMVQMSRDYHVAGQLSDEAAQRMDEVMNHTAQEINFLILPVSMILPALLLGYFRPRHGSILASLMVIGVWIAFVPHIISATQIVGPILLLAVAIGGAFLGRYLWRRKRASSTDEPGNEAPAP